MTTLCARISRLLQHQSGLIPYWASFGHMTSLPLLRIVGLGLTYTMSRKFIYIIHQKHSYVLTDTVEIGDRTFDASTAGKNVDKARQGRVKMKLFDSALLWCSWPIIMFWHRRAFRRCVITAQISVIQPALHCIDFWKHLVFYSPILRPWSLRVS